jgi:2-amino-4-ketopentanoate thiolase alpha subunit
VKDSSVSPTLADLVPAGTWVEVQQVVLKAGERSPNVPDDTASLDFVARIRGFLLADAPMGGDAIVRTLADRQVSGRLTAVNPRNPTDFGNPVPELLRLGEAARKALEEAGPR